MSDSRAVLDPDRLPWLTDDLPRGRRAWTSVLLLALLATVLLAGVSYWLGMESVRRAGDLAVATAPAPSTVPTPSVQPPQPLATAGPVPAPAMPEVPPVAEPVVAPPRVTDQRPAEPRPPPAQPAVSPPPSTAPVKPAPPPAATAASAPRPGVQSRASFNCRLARARWEIAVCNNGDLAALDRDLAALTSDVTGRADAARRTRLARTRDRFVARRNACQTDACTNAAYVARLREISDIMTGAAPSPGATPASSTPSPSAAPAQDRPAKPRATAAAPPKTAPPKPAAPKATPSKTASQSTARPRTIAQSRASFDCRLARTRGEIAVCNNGNLGLLDRQLALLYSQAWGRADAAKRARLLRTRDRFIARRDSCVSEMCTRIAYENRMRQVSDIMFGLDRQP